MKQDLTALEEPITFLSPLALTFFTESKGYLFAKALSANPDKEEVYLYMTQDGGSSWQISGTAIPSNYDPLLVVDDTHMYDVGSFLFTLTNGQWVKTSNVPVGQDQRMIIQFLSSQVGVALVGWVGSSQVVYRTSDGGQTWQKIGALSNGT